MYYVRILWMWIIYIKRILHLNKSVVYIKKIKKVRLTNLIKNEKFDEIYLHSTISSKNHQQSHDIWREEKKLWEHIATSSTIGSKLRKKTGTCQLLHFPFLHFQKNWGAEKYPCSAALHGTILGHGSTEELSIPSASDRSSALFRIKDSSLSSSNSKLTFKRVHFDCARLVSPPLRVPTLRFWGNLRQQ